MDIVYSRNRENIRRMVEAVRPLHPYLRGAPPGLPFIFDEKTVRNGLNFTLVTDLGELDVLGEVAGGGSYEQLIPSCEELQAFDVKINCISLEKLIQLKRAAGRPKDIETVAELQALLDERNRR